MNAACPGTWRALCTGIRSTSLKQPAPSLSIWAPAIRPLTVIRSFDVSLSSKWSGSPTLRIKSCRLETSSYYTPLLSTASKACHAKFSSSTRNNDVAPKMPSWLVKRKEYSADEIRAIFGRYMEPSEGNRIIRLVEKQRVAGTIDEDIPGLQTQKGLALAWLRKNVPFDEDRAIFIRLEREEQAALMPQAQRASESPYAKSVLERTRKQNIARREKVKEETEAKATAEGKSASLSREQNLVLRRQQSEALVKKWKDQAKEDDLHSVPQMSFIRRVGPATLLSATVIFLCALFAQNYTPPSQAARLFPSISPAAATTSVLIAMNCVVWVGWRWLPLRRFMMKVFCLVPAYPHASSMIGNIFSHQMFRHLFTNMIPLWIVGGNCKQP